MAELSCGQGGRSENCGWLCCVLEGESGRTADWDLRLAVRMIVRNVVPRPPRIYTYVLGPVYRNNFWVARKRSP